LQDERFSGSVRSLAVEMARLDDDFEAERLDEQVYQQEREMLEARTQEILVHFNFLLELSVLKHYNLVDHYDYKVEIKRNHFWIPFVSVDSVRVSILPREKEEKAIADTLPRGYISNFIDDLIVVVREKGTWKISQFNISDSAIASTYNDVRQNININKYTIKTTNGFRLQEADINLETLTPIDKRLLGFSLYRIKKSIDPPDKEDTGTSLYPSF
jgi:hypothetical protein